MKSGLEASVAYLQTSSKHDDPSEGGRGVTRNVGLGPVKELENLLNYRVVTLSGRGVGFRRLAELLW